MDVKTSKSIAMIEEIPEVYQLSNGVRVVYQKSQSFVAHMGVFIQAGSRYEGENEEGLAHFLEHCIFKGTKNRAAIDIFSDLDSVGGELNAYTTKEEICIHASFRNNHFSIASELLNDIVQFASFPIEEVEKEKEVVLDEIISYLDSPSERIFDEFESHMFKGETLGLNTLGTKESVSSFTRQDLSNYKEKYFVAENVVISFVGSISKSDFTKQLEENFGLMEQKTVILPKSPLLEFQKFSIVEKKANFQTHTLIGGRAPSYYDDSRRSMTLLTNVLGGPALNSRLILSVREKYGYAYSIEANYTSYSDAGFWSIYMGTDKKYLKKAKDLIYKELELIRSKGLTKNELLQAKEQLKGHIALSLDGNLEMMFSLAKSVIVHGRVDSMKEVYTQIDKISLAELKEVATACYNVSELSSLVYQY